MAEQAEISGRAAATRLGVSETALRKWRKRPDWDFGGPPYSPHQVDRIELWRGRTLRRGNRGIVPLVGAGADAPGAEAPAPPRPGKRRLLVPPDLETPSDEETENGERQDEGGNELGEVSDAELEGRAGEFVRHLAQAIKALPRTAFTVPIYADTLFKLQKIMSEQQRRRIQAGEWLPRDQVERDQNTKARAFAVGLQQQPRMLAPRLDSPDQQERESVLYEANKALLWEFVGNKEAAAKAWRLAEEYLNSGEEQ